MSRGRFRVIAPAITLMVMVSVLALLLYFPGGLAHHPQASAQASVQTTPKVRTYYIAADEVPWDYAPSGKNEITGEPFDDVANVFVKNGPDRIGHVYRKAQYREYTDATFEHLKPRPADEEYLGILGPVIRAQVGDTIKVIFKNNTSFPANLHPHGVSYKKDSEGSPYDDGTSGSEKSDDAVAPGKTHTYTWKVPERTGPGPMDPSTILWMYHSHVDEPADTNSGLIGPMIIGRRGSMNPDGTFKGIDHEVITLFTVFDENSSHYLDYNIQHYAGDPASVNPDDEEFGESNLMHSINGYVYGNMPMPKMKKGDHARWYTMGMGTEVDLHTPHWHG
ncbi:MAG TPA: multicopper oxidase domain-containing protein, partial [Rubrobacteraceae bacterium]|nr:multicopper oxidase domain-containing protein [Rubrobacteraceae bacterium]